MLRGVNKQNLFEDDEDRERLLSTLQYCKDTGGFLLYGYCLMDNHIHLLLREQTEPISHTMKRISSSYVYWFNRKYGRIAV